MHPAFRRGHRARFRHRLGRRRRTAITLDRLRRRRRRRRAILVSSSSSVLIEGRKILRLRRLGVKGISRDLRAWVCRSRRHGTILVRWTVCQCQWLY